MSRYSALLDIALECINEAEVLFVEGHGAQPAVRKGEGDFATKVDLNIETLLRERLQTRTGIAVVGEELGGQQAERMWVIDPIDGTSNYSVGNPMSAILLSLIEDGQPKVAVTSLPLAGQRFAACEGEALRCPASAGGKDVSHVGFSTITTRTKSPVPQVMRMDILGALACSKLRPRITGSVGVDLAYAAAGVFAVGVSLSPNVWDNAAGVLLGRAAGKTVTDIWGNPWHLGAVGAVIGDAEAHDIVMEIMQTQSKESQWASQFE
ncbi:inositol monophosphatase family protein [Corynebacterium gerontici]|uniref:Inositol-1-monophosphatase ImpA n=1 Tax=Corynebacterium gerontici TaxID=2079234 RepID=A0A3G6J176_9CORY|nr:inositol monophosphatase family protein [Corynebacterium gerontici]AZA11727.1 Inositol-1-monophosphatase ImpA [Corynebacterium gerontici]